MMTTVCTACNTEFLVTWEQLKVRAGRVRCGHCQTVFNAVSTLNRHREADTKPGNSTLPAQSSPFSSPVAGSVEEVVSTSPERTAIAGPVPAPTTQPVAAATAEKPSMPPAKSASMSWPTIDLGEKWEVPAAAPSPPTAQPESAPLPKLQAPDPDQVIVAAPAKTAEAEQPAAKPAVAADFDFGPKPQTSRSKWWWPMALLLSLALVGQALFYFRGVIAMLVPQAKPYINELCAELGCEVPLPRRVELVTIETSELQADPANPAAMLLLATLRNRAAFPQAFPALELTLTNERDLPLARRVLQAGDYLADKAEAFDASSEKQIRLNVEAAALKASGYRLYVFYP